MAGSGMEECNERIGSAGSVDSEVRGVRVDGLWSAAQQECRQSISGKCRLN